MALEGVKPAVTLEEALASGVIEKTESGYQPKDPEKNVWASAGDNDFSVVSLHELHEQYKEFGLTIDVNPYHAPGMKVGYFLGIFLKGIYVGNLNFGANTKGHFTFAEVAAETNFLHCPDLLDPDLHTSLQTLCDVSVTNHDQAGPTPVIVEGDTGTSPELPATPTIKSTILKEGGSATGNPDAIRTYPFGTLAATTDKGINYSDHNEDRVVINEVLDENGNVTGLDIFVIDGMGGHRGGEKAADIFAEECKNCDDLNEMLTRIKTRLDTDEKTKDGGGVCWAVAKIRGDEATIARMGDVRVSVCDRDGKMIFSTPDESIVAKGLSKGQMTLNDPQYYNLRHMVGNALQGGPEGWEFTKGHIWTIPLCEGDSIRLRSDGITDNFTDEEEIEFTAGLTAREAVYKTFANVVARIMGTYKGTSKILQPKPDNIGIAVYVHGKEDKVASMKAEAESIPPEQSARMAPEVFTQGMSDLVKSELAAGTLIAGLTPYEGKQRGYYSPAKDRKWQPHGKTGFETMPLYEVPVEPTTKPRVTAERSRSRSNIYPVLRAVRMAAMGSVGVAVLAGGYAVWEKLIYPEIKDDIAKDTKDFTKTIEEDAQFIVQGAKKTGQSIKELIDSTTYKAPSAPETQFDFGGWTKRTAPYANDQDVEGELNAAGTEAIFVITCANGEPVLANFIYNKGTELPSFDYTVDRKLAKPEGYKEISPNPFELCEFAGHDVWQYSLVR